MQEKYQAQTGNIILDSISYQINIPKILDNDLDVIQCHVLKNREIINRIEVILYTRMQSNLSSSDIYEYKVSINEILFPVNIIYMFYPRKNILVEITENKIFRYIKPINSDSITIGIVKLAFSFNKFINHQKTKRDDELYRQNLLNTVDKFGLLQLIK